MRIGIDCRLAGVEHAGLGRYTQSLVSELLTCHKEVDWLLFLNQKQQLSLFPKNAQFTPVITPVRHYTIKEQWQMNRAFTQAKLDLLHVPHFNVPLFYNLPFIVTIHDLLWHEQKGSKVTTLNPLVYWPKYLAYKLVVKSAVSKAKKILLPSLTVRNTLQKFYSVDQNKLVVSYEGVTLVPPTVLKYRIETPYLLYVGSLYPHKNVELVLKALKDLPFKLVVVSSRNVFCDQFQTTVRHLGLESRVKLLHHISDGELHTLYRSAFALLQPSLSEGFGLTGIEAMQAGTQVIASDIPIFKEIYQDAALYFSPTSVKSFISTLKSLDTSKDKLKKASQQLIKRYTWQKTAKITFDTYQKALALNAAKN